jgi:hypothetical protein
MAPYTTDQIEERFKKLRLGAMTIAGADLPEAERDQVRVLAVAVIDILESLITDINLIAYYASFDETHGA